MSATTQHTDWTLQIRFPESDETIGLTINNELMMGRRSSDQPVFNGLDLSPYNGEQLGVSRRHAKLTWEGGYLSITDVGSDNGTILNELRLQPQIAYKLTDGDTVHLGHLKMAIKLNTEIGTRSIRAKRIEINLANAPMRGHAQRILVVEDDLALSKLYQTLIEGAGYTAHMCRDVVSAIRVMNHQNAPAAILLDLKLPGVYGVELCRYVRRDTECPNIPIVVASAMSDEESVQAAMLSGVDIFVSKPFNPQDLVRILGALIYQSESANPTLGTKKLVGTASLDFLAPETRSNTLIFFVEGQREPVGTVVDTAVTMGRGNPGGGQSRNYVDLGSYGAFDKGVSRTHARVKRQGKTFTIEDLGSSNGTFVNGYSLGVQENHPLHNGDEIRLGELRMHIYLLVDATA